MIDKLKYYIINYSVYDKEPLYAIVGSIIKENICQDLPKISDAIIELFNDGYLDAYYYRNSKYQKLQSLEKKELLQHIKNYATSNFENIPDEKYYFQATKMSYGLLKEKDRPIIEK